MATTVPAASSSRRRSAKPCIFAALIVTLFSIAVIAIASIILSPAHIYFCVADATTSNGGSGRGWRKDYYHLTLVANNTSRHTAVRYGAINVEIWYSPTGWVPAEVDASELPWEWQPPRNAASIAVSAEYWQWQHDVGGRQEQRSKANGTWPRYPVVVMAKVWFRLGQARTWPYSVRVSCPAVDFFGNNGTFPVNCTA